jgi:hypothetical protein
MASHWSQFVAMTLAQLSDRTSLRDFIANMSVQAHHLNSMTLEIQGGDNTWVNI